MAWLGEELPEKEQDGCAFASIVITVSRAS